MSAAFYCISSDVYFLAAVGMVNSLRLVGHTEPVFVLDCGLTREQRRLLEREATVVDGPNDEPHFLLKTMVAARRPAEVMILIDADIVVTRSLAPLIEEARRGGVVAGQTGLDRFRPEWAELLDLGPLARKPYVSSALVVLGGELGAKVIELVDDRLDRVDFERTYFRRNVTGYPLLHAEEDVLNAVLAATAEDDQLVAFDQRLSASPPFEGLEVRDARTLRCAYADGLEPYVVHHWLAKPWLEPTYDGVYSQLLRRLLVGDDVAVRIPLDWVPRRFRDGVRGLAERKAINLRERLRSRFGGEPSSPRRRARA